MRPLRAIALAGVMFIAGAPGSVVIGSPPDESDVMAYVDGRRIPVEHIPRYFCDDFSYPVITCSVVPVLPDTRATVAALSGVTYVTIYDLPTYSGTWMHVSQDYGSLLTVGWNDKVSSFRGRNSETGRFWTDWFSTGTSWSFCCNTGVSSLGTYNNTFSTVERT